ncbi:MAG: hypothetical protein ACRDFZ_02655 [Candidatus Limnocylindria bacterium]
MLSRRSDPRTEDIITYDLVRSGPQGEAVIGSATFQGGRWTVDAPENVRASLDELLARPFVDRVRADERPRGYRRSGQGQVDMLVPGMAEHFVARMRGLWLAFPDQTVVTAREGLTQNAPPPAAALPEASETGPPVVDPAVRRSTLERADNAVSARALVRAADPDAGTRPAGTVALRRTDCGWIV